MIDPVIADVCGLFVSLVFGRIFLIFQAEEQLLEEIAAAEDRGDPDARARLVRAVTGYELPDGHAGLLIEPQGQNVENEGGGVGEVVEPEVQNVQNEGGGVREVVQVPEAEVGGGNEEMEASQVEIGAPAGVFPIAIVRNVCFLLVFLWKLFFFCFSVVQHHEPSSQSQSQKM